MNVPASEWDQAPGPGGYAFVVAHTATTSDLLTDYHLLVDAYLAGGRTVLVADGASTYTARIVAVSPDPHVARIRVDAALPVLPISAAPAHLGDPVTIRGRDRAAAAGVVMRYRGPGATSHLVFSVTVPADLDGAPVLDRHGRVVGIAEPSDQFTTVGGVGFAVPIAAACGAVTC